MNNNFFSILISIVNKVLDWLKNVLVRFKKAGFGLFFIKNLFILPEFFSDREYSIFAKIKVVLTFLVTIFYFMSSFDFLPEVFFGGFGFIDDFLILAWGIGLINEELAIYKTEFENSLKSKIIEDVHWEIRDDKE